MLVWRSGFEKGFPGEWHTFSDGSFLSPGRKATDRLEAWSVVDKDHFSKVLAGSRSYKGWAISGRTDGKKHRAYPVLHSNIRSPLVNSFWIYFETDYRLLQSQPENWISFATFSNSLQWKDLFTLSISERGIIHMWNLDWRYVEAPKTFPVRRWVRLTVYIDYASGAVVVWQDGVRIMFGNYRKGTQMALRRAHWGLYTSPKVTSTTVYQDEVAIWKLSTPWRSNEEPPAPYKIRYNAGALP